jgi:hypothetical protein
MVEMVPGWGYNDDIKINIGLVDFLLILIKNYCNYFLVIVFIEAWQIDLAKNVTIYESFQ